MNQDTVTQLAMHAMRSPLEVSVPFLIAGLVVGLARLDLPGGDQIQEMTLSFIPKILVTGAVIVVAGPVDARPARRLHAEPLPRDPVARRARDEPCRSSQPTCRSSRAAARRLHARAVPGRRRCSCSRRSSRRADDPDAGEADRRRRDLVRADAARRRAASDPDRGDRGSRRLMVKESSSALAFALALGCDRRRGPGRGVAARHDVGFSYAALIDPITNTPDRRSSASSTRLFAVAGVRDDRRRPADDHGARDELRPRSRSTAIPSVARSARSRRRGIAPGRS